MTAPTPATTGERVGTPIAAFAEADRLRLALSYYHKWDDMDFGAAEDDVAELAHAARLALDSIDESLRAARMEGYAAAERGDAAPTTPPPPVSDAGAMTAPTPATTGERVTVDAGALEAFMREAIHLIDDVAPDSDGRRFVANLASELDATAAPLAPAAVDAGTLLPVEEWISDVLVLRDHADSEDRDILTRTAERLRILSATAALTPADDAGAGGG